MTILSSSVRTTPDDLLSLEGEGLFELVDGKLIEKQMSLMTSETAGRIGGLLFAHSDPRKLGTVLPEANFRCFPDDADKIRRPDVAFIAKSNMPANPNESFISVVPDIAIEVISPNDKIYELDEKLADYRSAGVSLIWIINPNSRVIRIYRAGRPIEELFDGDTLRADPVLPDFSLNVTDLLPEPIASSNT